MADEQKPSKVKHLPFLEDLLRDAYCGTGDDRDQDRVLKFEEQLRFIDSNGELTLRGKRLLTGLDAYEDEEIERTIERIEGKEIRLPENHSPTVSELRQYLAETQTMMRRAAMPIAEDIKYIGEEAYLDQMQKHQKLRPAEGELLSISRELGREIKPNVLNFGWAIAKMGYKLSDFAKHMSPDETRDCTAVAQLYGWKGNDMPVDFRARTQGLPPTFGEASPEWMRGHIPGESKKEYAKRMTDLCRGLAREAEQNMLVTKKSKPTTRALTEEEKALIQDLIRDGQEDMAARFEQRWRHDVAAVAQPIGALPWLEDGTTEDEIEIPF